MVGSGVTPKEGQYRFEQDRFGEYGVWGDRTRSAGGKRVEGKFA